MKKLILLIIRFYQQKTPFLFLTHQSCRFQPTCSEYTYQAISRYGIIRGSWLGLKRISHCHPWGKAGFDPLPVSKNNKKKK